MPNWFSPIRKRLKCPTLPPSPSEQWFRSLHIEGEPIEIFRFTMGPIDRKAAGGRKREAKSCIRGEQSVADGDVPRDRRTQCEPTIRRADWAGRAQPPSRGRRAGRLYVWSAPPTSVLSRYRPGPQTDRSEFRRGNH